MALSSCAVALRRALESTRPLMVAPPDTAPGAPAGVLPLASWRGHHLTAGVGPCLHARHAQLVGARPWQRSYKQDLNGCAVNFILIQKRTCRIYRIL